jgi:hypothetical protein
LEAELLQVDESGVAWEVNLPDTEPISSGWSDAKDWS